MAVKKTAEYAKEACDAIKAHLENGLHYRDIEKESPRLIKFISDEYGGFIPFLIENGYDYTRYSHPTKVTKYKSKTATKEELDKYLTINFKGKRSVSKKHLEPWSAIKSEEVYGSVSAALRSNGATPRLMSDEEISNISNDIVSLYNEGLSVKKVSESLLISVKVVDKVLKDLQVDMRHIEPYLSKQEVDDFLIRICDELGDKQITSPKFKECYPTEFRSIKKVYGNLGNGFSSCGAYVLDKKVPKSWSKSFLIGQIKQAVKEGYPINCDYIIKNASSARAYAQKVFGGWREALEASGVNYDELLKKSHKYSYFGHRFEAILGEILTDLGIKYEKINHGPLQPDFAIGDEWIDAKLSQTTAFSSGCDTIEKYEPHCEKLTIVYLRGNGSGRSVSDKTTLTHVSYYTDKLRKDRRDYFNEKLRNINDDLTISDAS